MVRSCLVNQAVVAIDQTNGDGLKGRFGMAWHVLSDSVVAASDWLQVSTRIAHAPVSRNDEKNSYFNRRSPIFSC